MFVNRDKYTKKLSILGLNGGLVSTTLLLNLIANNYEVYPIYINYGQLNSEMKILQINNVLDYLNTNLNLEMKLDIIEVKGLNKIYNLGELNSDLDLIKGVETLEKINNIYYPNRIGFILNFLKGYALKKSKEFKKRCNLSYGITYKDKMLYPDQTHIYRKKDYLAFKEGNQNSDYIDFYTPFSNITSTEVLDRGLKYCIQLSLDFNEIYKNTSCSYKPININGKWYSDYKSPAVIQRIVSFTDLNIKDPLEYADEESKLPVDWKVVKNYTINSIFENKYNHVKATTGHNRHERLTQEQILELLYETEKLYLYNSSERYYDECDNITSIDFGSQGQKVIIKGVNKEGVPLHSPIGKTFFPKFLDVPINNNQHEKLSSLYQQALLENKQNK